MQRHAKLERELADENFQQALVERVNDAKARLSELRYQLGLGLESVRAKLLAQMGAEIEVQAHEVSRYRLAARHAQARIADLLYRQLEEAPVTELDDKGSEENTAPKDVGKGPNASLQSSEVGP